MPALRRLLVALLAACVAATLLSPPGSASGGAGEGRGARGNPVGSDKFVTSAGYRGDFPDPSVLRVGNRWYAYGTTVSGMNLPVLTSTDLVRWYAVGEGLNRPARWSAARRTGGKHWFAPTWAPSVARFGNRYVHAYAVKVGRTKLPRMCISTSVSRRPASGFVDRTRGALVCYPDRGAIDPSFFTAVDGRRYLLWKSEQTATAVSQLFIAPISSDGRRRTGPATRLLMTQDPWEGPLVENPSMVRAFGRYYLFYSGGTYGNANYATGYAICTTPLGPCTRASTEPLLATGGTVAGTGGASAFVDAAGRLRLAYAAWDFGNTGYPSSPSCLFLPAGCAQRRMHVATLAPSPDGTGQLVVTSRG